MTFQQAKKLHSGDEVTIKKTKEVVVIKDIEIYRVWQIPSVVISVVDKDNIWQEYLHTEIS